MKRTHRKFTVVAACSALLGLSLAGCGTNAHLAATPLVRVVHRATHRVAWEASPIPYEMVARPVVDQAVQVPILMYHDATYLPGDSLGLAPGQGFRTLLAPSFGPSVRVLGLRKFPYPYRAMLSISSDADHQTLRKFTMIHEFLNTHAMTPLGKGLGLDISDSFFLYNGSNLLRTIDYRRTPLDEEMTYFNGISDRPYDAALIQRYILHGWIDTLHSFGDFSLRDPFQTKFSRRLAVQALQALAVAGDHLTVWTDHGNQSNVDDFGSYGKSGFYRYQQGANPQSPYHVTDLLIPYGVHFMWADQPSDAFGQYSMIYPKTLPDGRKVWGFWRYTNTSFSARGTPDWTWSVGDLARQMTIQHLLQIENLHQYAILAQHLSANDALDPLPPNAIDALHLLANQYHAGHILVARTSRLLTYNVAQQYVRFRVTQTGHFAVIHITAIADPVFGTHRPTVSALRGVTFYTTNPGQTQLDIGNTPVPAALVQRNETDGIAPSIGIKWYPSDTRDYAVWDRSVRRT